MKYKHRRHSKKKSTTIGVRFYPEELKILDHNRGNINRSTYIRVKVLMPLE